MIMLVSGEFDFSHQNLKHDRRTNLYVTDNIFEHFEKQLNSMLWLDKVRRMTGDEQPGIHNGGINKFIYISDSKKTNKIKISIITDGERKWEFLNIHSSFMNRILEEIKGKAICFQSHMLNDPICQIIKNHRGEIKGWYYKVGSWWLEEIEEVNLFLETYSSLTKIKRPFNKEFDFVKHYSSYEPIPNPLDAILDRFTFDICNNQDFNLTYNPNKLNKKKILLFNQDSFFTELLINSLIKGIGEEPYPLFLDAREIKQEELEELKKVKYLVVHNVETQNRKKLNSLINYLLKFGEEQKLIFISNTVDLSRELRLLFNKFITVPTFELLLQKEGITKIFYALLYYCILNFTNENDFKIKGSEQIMNSNGFADQLGDIKSLRELFNIINHLMKDRYTSSLPEMMLYTVDFWYEFAYVRQTLVSNGKIEDEYSSNNIIEAKEKEEGNGPIELNFILDKTKDEANWLVTSNLFDDSREIGYEDSLGVRIMEYLIKIHPKKEQANELRYNINELYDTKDRKTKKRGAKLSTSKSAAPKDYSNPLREAVKYDLKKIFDVNEKKKKKRKINNKHFNEETIPTIMECFKFSVHCYYKKEENISITFNS